jgi:hypothetical protein
MGRSLGAGLRGFKDSLAGESRPTGVAELSPGSDGAPQPAADNVAGA